MRSGGVRCLYCHTHQVAAEPRPEGSEMSELTTCLWFDTQAEEAAQFYASVFPDSKVGKLTRYHADDPMAAQIGRDGSVMTVEFEILGQKFVGLNGGPEFRFNEAVSFQIPCADQDEVDTYWSKLTADGGEEGPCGWLKDKFGVSWQVVPNVLIELTTDPDPARALRATQAMYQMKKIDIAALQAAADAQ
jgi:predicted 3-demethylubiquinone-9 3-methyltransferase (glyoxalase superfamily)